jgi:adenosine kinase
LADKKHLPIYAELVQNYKVNYIAGGAAQNTIRVAQWILQKPKATTFIGAVGKDNYGAQLRKCAEGDGVHPLYIEDEKEPTGTCAVLIKDKERTLIANLAAASTFKLTHLQSEAVSSVWKKASFFYVEGYFIAPAADCVAELAKYAHENNKTFALNLSGPWVCEFHSEPLLKILPYVDIIFGNESEAAALAKKLGWKDGSPAGVALELANYAKENKSKPRLAVITNGSNATSTSQNGESKQFPVPPLEKEKILDTNGAGDAFAGGFLAYHILGHSLADSIAAGHYAARNILQVSGTVLSGKPDFTPSK